MVVVLQEGGEVRYIQMLWSIRRWGGQLHLNTVVQLCLKIEVHKKVGSSTTSICCGPTTSEGCGPLRRWEGQLHPNVVVYKKVGKSATSEGWSL